MVESNGLGEDKIKGAVAKGFGRFGESGSKRDRPCCQKEAEVIDAEARYTADQLASAPKEAIEVSAGCGNPLALVDVKEGQTVLDLGCGGGIDVFLAAQKVGPEGKAIGVDFARGMIERARKAAEKAGYKNVEFKLGDMEDLPLESESVDVVISNCVINLSPDKDKVFEEAYRVLKPGGKLSISDTTTIGALPPEIRNDLDLWVKCVAGAIDEKVYAEKIRKAGFTDVELKQRFFYTKEDLAALLNLAGEDEMSLCKVKKLLETEGLPQIASSKFVASKPTR